MSFLADDVGPLSPVYPDNRSRLCEVLQKVSCTKPLKTGVPDWAVLASLVILSCLMFALPMIRAFYRVEVNYNEGWNAYNAQAVADHLPLYLPKYSWTTVNYPMISFYMIGFLSRVLGDPMVIGRMISLISFLSLSVLVALIIKKLTGNWKPAIFGASFCVALFCADAQFYIGMNDPQMFAHLFFLIGLFLYVSGAPSNVRIFAITALFVWGGNIKQNLIALPIALFVDLLIVSRGKAARYVLFGVLLLTASLVIDLHVGGPYFFSKLLTPRVYSLRSARLSFLNNYEALQIPLIISLAWSLSQLRNNRFRSIALYFLISLFVGMAFGGGAGVSVNAYFDNFLGMSIIMGLVLNSVWESQVPLMQKGSAWRWAPPLLIIVGVVFAFCDSYLFNVPENLHSLPAQNRVFLGDASFLAAQPGPAICESLLLCYYSGKPYVFDPFNSTSLVRFKKLDGQEIVRKIAAKRFGAIQTSLPVTEFPRPYSRFPDDVLDAIDRYYKIAWRSSNAVIYVPR